MKPISKNQFDLYVFFTRYNLAEFFNEELEWYMNESKTLWAVICLDRQDRNYTVIFLARDENRQIRCIDLKIDIEDRETAKEIMLSHSKWLEKKSLPEKKNNKRIVDDLFMPRAKISKLNPYFRIIAKSPAHSAARNVINEIMPHFFDVDGNFVQQFQTTGFDSRLWELYLFCYFNEEGLQINRDHFAPDFLLSSEDSEVSVEAVTISNKNPKEISSYIPTKEDTVKEQKLMSAKWGSSLYSKLTHKDKTGVHYWEYQHTKEKPFVIAIADFHDTLSMTWSRDSLITYLYGFEYNHSFDSDGNLIVKPIKVTTHSKGEGRNSIPSGFFFQENSENISAVLHSSCATISKFNRIGKQCGLDENNVVMLRTVMAYNPDPKAVIPQVFSYLVTEQDSEHWSEGVTVFHNPNAKYPLPDDFFPNAAQCYLDENIVVTYAKNPVVYSSITDIFTETSKMEDFKKGIEKDNI